MKFAADDNLRFCPCVRNPIIWADDSYEMSEIKKNVSSAVMTVALNASISDSYHDQIWHTHWHLKIPLFFSIFIHGIHLVKASF